MHKLDLLSILTQASGLGILATDNAFQGYITTLAGKNAPIIIATVGLVAVLASTVLRIIGSPSFTGVKKSS